MFKYSAFIRKNTPELRAKLEELGYNPLQFFLTNTCLYTMYTHWANAKRSWIEYDFATEKIDILSRFSEKYIDCGINESLFLAIAAIRDDSDYMQWFVSNVPIRRGCVNGNLVSENDMSYDWILSKVDKVTAKLRHKATLEELIEHFK